MGRRDRGWIGPGSSQGTGLCNPARRRNWPGTSADLRPVACARWCMPSRTSHMRRRNCRRSTGCRLEVPRTCIPTGCTKPGTAGASRWSARFRRLPTDRAARRSVRPRSTRDTVTRWTYSTRLPGATEDVGSVADAPLSALEQAVAASAAAVMLRAAPLQRLRTNWLLTLALLFPGGKAPPTGALRPGGGCVRANTTRVRGGPWHKPRSATFAAENPLRLPRSPDGRSTA